MRAKQNFKIKLLICCLMVLLLGTLLVACNKYEPDHYDYLVTFDYNIWSKVDGEWANTGPKSYLGVLDPDKENEVGALVSIRPGFNASTFSEASIAGYYLADWYLPLLDEDGNEQGETIIDPVTGEETYKIILCEEPFVFESTRIHENITLYAKLNESPKMRFIDADTGEFVSEIDGKRPGEKRSKPSSALAPKKVVDGESYTFIGEYYKDKACTEVFDFPYTFGEDNVDVYCHFIKGDWTIVNNTRDFLSALGGGDNIYLTEDLDFSGQLFSSQNYNGELNGNGHTISGISLNYTGRNGAISRFNKTPVGVFQTLMGRSYVHDITFKDVIINVETSESESSALGVNIGFLAAEASEGARVEKVTISGTLTANSKIRQHVGSGSVLLSSFIARNDAGFDKIVDCDYSGVKVIYLS